MKNICLAPDVPTASANPPAAEKPTLQQQLDAANAKIAELTAKQQQTSDTEKKILEITAKGLTRPQALSIIKRQAQYDASPIAKERGLRKSGETIETRNARRDKIMSAAQPKS